MSITELLSTEFDREVAATQAMLSRVPASNPDWTPHPKSMSMGKLAMHVAEISNWGSAILTSNKFDIAPADGPAYAVPAFKSAADAVAMFDTGVVSFRSALKHASDASLDETWQLVAGPAVVFSMPRLEALQTWVLNHIVHHRAQLGVYLRMHDVPLPGTYGPSADTM